MDKLFEILKGAGLELTDELKSKIESVWPDTDGLLTQDKVDEIVRKRLAREQEKHEAELDELRGKMEKLVDPSQVEQVKSEFNTQLEEAKKSRLAEKKLYELKLAATKAGAKDLDYLEYLVEKNGYQDRVDIGEDGKLYVTKDGKPVVDDKGQPLGLNALVEEIKAEKPDLFKPAKDIGNPSNPGDQHHEENPWQKGKVNLTKQGELLRNKPSLAKQFIIDAGLDPAKYGL